MANNRLAILREQRRRNRSKKTSRNHASRPRLVVHRSLKHFEAQIIDDFKGVTLVSASSKDKDLKSVLSKKRNKTDISKLVGEEIAKKAKKAKIGPVVFDRNGYPYHGRVKTFAHSARENGLEL
tara:strand:+ start:338 stop:709 length:372 start_codon:yes stop_codon:yes gene_type:complete